MGEFLEISNGAYIGSRICRRGHVSRGGEKGHTDRGVDVDVDDRWKDPPRE